METTDQLKQTEDICDDLARPRDFDIVCDNCKNIISRHKLLHQLRDYNGVDEKAELFNVYNLCQQCWIKYNDEF